MRRLLSILALVVVVIGATGAALPAPTFDQREQIGAIPRVCVSNEKQDVVWKVFYELLPGEVQWAKYVTYYTEYAEKPFLVVEFDGPMKPVRAWLRGQPVDKVAWSVQDICRVPGTRSAA